MPTKTNAEEVIKPHFDVPDETFTIILEHPDGAVYRAQVGGMLCLHREVTGYVIDERQLNWKFSMIFRELTDMGCQYGCCTSPITSDGFKHMESIWPKPPDYTRWWITLDADRWNESTEAWIPIKTYATEDERPIVSYVEDADTIHWLRSGVTGFLITENCD